MTTPVSQVQIRRDTNTNVAAYTGPVGEIIANTTTNRLHLQDGLTAGGVPMAKLSEIASVSRTAVADANYTVLTTDRVVVYTSLTSARTITLPAASAFPTGVVLWIGDESGSCASTKAITINRAGADTINGGTSTLIGTAYGAIALESDGTSKWTRVVGQNETRRTAVADANYTVLSSDRIVAYTSLTAARAVTLPAASAYPVGTLLWIVDESGSCSSTNTITISRAGADTIDGATSNTLNGAYQATAFGSDGSSKWTTLGRNPNESLTSLGIGVAPDASNPLKVSATTSLLTSGSDHTFKINKNAAANTGIIEFETGLSKRAQIGTIGNDHLQARVSPDGSTIYNAIDIDQNTGNVAFPVMIGGLKNRIINGNFNIWQRGTSVSVANASQTYCADRWLITNTLGVTATVAQSAPASGMRGQNCMKITATSVAAAGFVGASQRFESQMLADLDGAPCILSFDLNASTSAGSISGVYYVAGNTASDNGTWSVVLVNYTAFTINAGSNKVSIALTAAQTAGLKYGAQIQLIFTQNTSTGNPTIYLGSVQFEQGSVANAFEFRPQSLELVMCQRYFTTSFPFNTAPADNLSANWHGGFAWDGTNVASQRISLQVKMRTQPTIVAYAPSLPGWSSGRWFIFDGVSAYQSSATTTGTTPQDDGFAMNLTGLTVTTKSTYICYGNWTASAEL